MDRTKEDFIIEYVKLSSWHETARSTWNNRQKNIAALRAQLDRAGHRWHSTWTDQEKAKEIS